MEFKKNLWFKSFCLSECMCVCAATSPIKTEMNYRTLYNAELKQSVECEAEKCQNEGEIPKQLQLQTIRRPRAQVSTKRQFRAVHIFAEMQHQQTSIKYDRRKEMNVLQFQHSRPIKISLPENIFLKIMNSRSICTIFIALSTVSFWVFSSHKKAT